MTTTVKAYYDGTALVPMTPTDFQKGSVFVLSVMQKEIAISPFVHRNKIASFLQFTAENKTIEKEYKFNRNDCYDR
ncbi:hypothetical protein AGMMS4956_20410 [Bacteroidia bacterium]|nr:hypothetical protein AGMMS4956_20410 [Bacteroidia bacterium]